MHQFGSLCTWSQPSLIFWLVSLLIMLPLQLADGEPQGQTLNKPTDNATEQAHAYVATEGPWRASGPKGVLPVEESQAVVHFTLSNFYFYRWNLELAQVELEEAIAHWPDFKAAHRDLCLVSLSRGNFSRAMAEFMMVVGLGDPIPLSKLEMANLNRRALHLHYKTGIDHARYSRWQDAAAEFQWALTYEPKNPIVRRSLAFAYARLNEFEKAESEYESTFALDPTDAFAHADFAFLLSDKGHNERATRQMYEAVQLAPAAAALHVDLGWMAEARGDFFIAANEFEQAVKLSPRHAGLWAHFGRLLERLGRSSEAIDAYCKALKLDPQYKEARERIARLKVQASSQI